MSWQFVVLLLFIHPVFASETLESIEVSASKELGVFNLGSSEKPPIKKSATALTSEVVESTPGVVSAQNGGPGSRTSYFIRGTEARHVSFTIDNLKINDPSNTDRQFDGAFLTNPFLKEITVYKGPQAVLFGSDALGGLVDMRTRKGENPGQTRLALNGGSFGTFDSSLSQDWQKGSDRGTLTWTSFRTDGISRLNKKRYNATERDAADTTQLTSSSAHNWNEFWQTDFLVSFSRGHSELDGFTDDNSHDHSRSDQYLLQQRTSHELNSNSVVSLRNGLSRQQRQIDTLSVGENAFAGDLIQNEVLHNYENSRFHLLTGLGNETEKFNQGGEDRQAILNSIFSQASYRLHPIIFQAGLRADHHSRYKGYYTGSTGVALENGPHTLALQYSQGLKSPSLYQLYAEPLFGAPIGNKELVPEKNNALEARWSFRRKELTFEFSWFRNSLSQLITFTNQGYRNQGHFISQGTETAVAWKDRHFAIRPSLTLQDFKEEKEPVLRRPSRSFAVDFSLFPREALEIFLRVRSFSSRKDISETGQVVKLNGYETLGAGVNLQRGLSDYGLQILNLTDRMYEDLYGYSVMPRSLFVHFGHRF